MIVSNKNAELTLLYYKKSKPKLAVIKNALDSLASTPATFIILAPSIKGIFANGATEIPIARSLAVQSAMTEANGNTCNATSQNQSQFLHCPENHLQKQTHLSQFQQKQPKTMVYKDFLSN